METYISKISAKIANILQASSHTHTHTETEKKTMKINEFNMALYNYI